MERLTNKKEADAQRKKYEIRLAAGYPRNIPEERFLKLAAYEDTGLAPEEITTEPYGCVFYCNRKCNLDDDWCAEGPGCPWECDSETIIRLLTPPPSDAQPAPPWQAHLRARFERLE